jgi:chemotaxis protein histidine kinase CheA
LAPTDGGASSDVRSSALWGTGGRDGDHRARRGRGILVAAVASLSLVLPISAGADDSDDSTSTATYIAPAVYQAAARDPHARIQVIIQSAEGTDEAKEAFKDAEEAVQETVEEAEEAAKEQQKAAAEEQDAASDAATAAHESADASAKVARAARKARSAAEREAARAAREAARLAARHKAAQDRRALAEERARTRREAAARYGSPKLAKLMEKLKLVGAVSAEMPASWVYLLERERGLTVTLDSPVEATAFSAAQLWPHQAGVTPYWGSALNPGPKPPAIAIVDSGIDRGVVGFGVAGSRVVHREVLTTLPQDATKLDGRGHGTFVAQVAASDSPLYTGVAPRADLVDVDVIDDQGMARTSDVIRAAEWILKNKNAKNIRVANFSLHSSSVLSIRHHPLNKAVQQLWLNGVVVVAAAGNYGSADGPSGVKHAPGNDPFVITVGAYDLQGSPRIRNHEVPSWSAYGYTNEGFAKPDVVAAGRSLVAPAPVGATLGLEKADRIVGVGMLRLSGT